MKKCLVIGGGGFIGSHLAEKLVDKGYSVSVFDNFKNGRANLDAIKNRLEIIEGDFLDEHDVSQALKNMDYVFHYISTTVPATAKIDPVYDIQTNVVGSIRLFQQALKSNIKKVIFSSSGGTIYGEPVNIPICEDDPAIPIDPYGISKMSVERYLEYFYRVNGLDYMILRYSNPFGERQNPFSKQGVIPIFLNKIRLGESPLVYGDGSMVRDYIYIQDAINATIAVLESKTSEKIFNIGSGIGTSVKELLAVISKVVDRPVSPQYIDNGGISIQKIVLDISRIQNTVGWQLETNLEDGIRKTWQWIARVEQ